MASSCFVYLTAKAASPVGIMKSNATIKRHPEGYRAFILVGSVRPLGSPQNLILLFVGQRENSRRRIILFGNISGNTGRIPDNSSVLHQINMLSGQIHLGICASPVLLSPDCCG